MKKTVTINISGIIFHIDEDAYDRLNRYMSRLKKHFSRMEGRDEIITDIESRIAELLQEKVADNKQVITIADIEEVVKMMGEPAEMDQDSDYEAASTTTTRTYNRPKRLFRDPDNRMIAGVSSGLAAYFSIDPVWIRILFIVSIFLSGAGVVAYIVLWIVVPQALTTADKLEMRGEPVNISNIERSFRDEFDNVKDKFNEFTDGAKESFKKKSPHNRTIFDALIEFIGGALRVVLKIAVVIIGLILVLAGLGFITSIVVGAAGLSNFSFFEHGDLISFSISNFLSLIFPDPISGVFAVISVILLTGIPLIMMVYLGIRLIAGPQVRIPYVGITAFAFWLAGLVMAIVVGAGTAMDFRHSARSHQDYGLEMPAGKTLYIRTAPDPGFGLAAYDNSAEIFDGEWRIRMNNERFEVFAVPKLSIQATSYDTKSLLDVSCFAKGSSRNEAQQRAEALLYPVKSNDSTFILPPYYYFPGKSKIRDQHVELRLHLPVGQVVYFDQNMEDFFDDNPNYYYRRNNMEGQSWIMTQEGLKPHVSGEEIMLRPETKPKEHANSVATTKVLGMIPMPLYGI